jgi:hypothetical protein
MLASSIFAISRAHGKAAMEVSEKSVVKMIFFLAIIKFPLPYLGASIIGATKLP